MTRFDTMVGFHSGKPHTEDNPIAVHIASLPETIAHLEAQGVGALFVPKDNYDTDASGAITVRGYAPEWAGRGDARTLALPRTLHEAPLAAGGIQAVRSRIATPDTLQGVVPIVNGLAVRQFGASKYAQAALLEGLMPATQLIKPGEQVTDELLDGIAGPEVALKADNGAGGRHKRIGVAKGSAGAALADLRAELGDKATQTSILVQEMASGGPMHELRAADPEQQPLIDDATERDSFELGVYCFADRARGTLALRPNAVYRLNPGDPERDQWVPVEQGSVDPAYFALAGQVAGRVLDAHDVPAALLRVDLLRTADGAHLVREVNTRDPDLGLKYKVLRQTHGRLLADQLAAVARA